MFKKFIIRSLLFTPIAFTVIATNYMVDPANIFRPTAYESGIANHLLSGKNVANITDYDERLVQELYIKGIKLPKDIIVLGSSRSMQIGEEIAPESNLFNSSVSGATLEDIVSIYEIYKKRNLLPETIIIGLDPWILNRNHNQFRWKTLLNSYDSITHRLGLANNDSNILEYYLNRLPHKYFDFFSISYFQSSLKFILEGKAKKAYYTTYEVEEDSNVRIHDGSLSYNRELRDRSIENTSKSAVAYALRQPVYLLGEFKELDEFYCDMMEELLIDYLSRGGHMVFFLPPYHPKAYEILIESDTYKIIHSAEKYFVDLARRYKVPVVGSYDPEKSGLTDSDFYDGMHPKRSAVHELFAKMTLPK